MYTINKTYTWFGGTKYQVRNVETGKILFSTSSWNEANDCVEALERMKKVVK